MIFRRQRFDRELDEELQTHLAEREAAYVRDGLAPEEARRRARLDFGNVAVLHEQARDVWLVRWLDVLARDVRIAVRGIRSAPGFAAAVILTLGLGIGANTAMFSVVDATLLQPLPYADAGRLVVVGDANENAEPAQLGFTTIQDVRGMSRSLDGLAVIRSWSPTIVDEGAAERIPALRVSHDFFSLLGVRPAMGRDFHADEDRPDQWRVVIISDGLWRRRFGADPAILGRTIRMADRDFEIVGVLPRDYEPLISARFFQAAEMWAPLGYAVTDSWACRSCQHLRVIGRLAPGVDAAAAMAELTALRDRLREQYPDDYNPGAIAVQPIGDAITGDTRRALIVLFAAVGLVLLIACANVGNLFLSRSIGRRGEMALRTALGASRTRVVTQLIVEAMTLGALGGLAGVALAWLLVDGAAAIAPAGLLRIDQVRLDGRVLAFAAAIALGTGVLFGLLPALRFSSLRASIGATSRGSAGGHGNRARAALIVVDVALAVLLLTGAGLMVRSVMRLLTVDPGFRPDGVVTLQMSLVGNAWREDAAVRAFQQRLLDRVDALPGVGAATIAGQLPLAGNFDTWGVDLRVPRPGGAPLDFQRYSVTPSYLRVMGIPLLRGRFITHEDTATSQPVVVLSQSAAEAAWPGEDPLGREIHIGAPERPWLTVVGVVGNVRHLSLQEEPDLQMYLPQEQITDSYISLAVRAAGVPPDALVPSLRAAVRELDFTVPVYQVASYDTLLAEGTARERFVMRLLGAFAAVAMLLAAVGLYGVVSYAVAHRRRELALRAALGARPSQVARLVARGGATAIAAGLLAGLTAAYLLSGALGALLYGVEPGDPAVMAAALGTLLLVAAAAHVLPIARALRVPPAAALGKE